MDVPFVAIGADELGGPVLSTITCPHCGESHTIEQSGPSRTLHSDGTESIGPSGLLQFYKCGSTAYLAGMHGRSV